MASPSASASSGSPKGTAKKRSLDERLHALLVRAYGIPMHDDFAEAQVERVMAKLNAARAPASPLEGIVLWLNVPTAFTLPGRFVYVSRRLLERCRSDDSAAFALAHEVAHHDLGHLHRMGSAIERVGVSWAMWITIMLATLEHRLYSYEKEMAADASALKMVRGAGYDAHRALEVFHILEEYMLDNGDIEGVYGSDAEIELATSTARKGRLGRLRGEWHQWLLRRHRSHPALVERVQRLQELASLGDAADSSRRD